MWHSAEGHHAAGWPLPSFFNGHTRRVTSSTQIEAEKLESDDDDGKSDEMSVGFVDWGTNISISTWLTADETDDWQGAAHRHVNTWTPMNKIILARTVFENHTKKVSFNIASEASYVYILSGQKFTKKCQKWSNLTSFWKPKACGQTVLPDRSALIGQKLVENAKIRKFICDILGDFQTMRVYARHTLFTFKHCDTPFKSHDNSQFS